MNAKTTTWIGGAVVAALVLLVAGWFLLISPALDSASQANADAESAEAGNDVLRVQIAKLKEQTEHLDEYKAQLASLRRVVPSDAELADYNRSIGKLAEDAGVTITNFAAGTPIPVEPADTGASTPAGTDAAPSADASASPTPSPTPTAAAGDQTQTPAPQQPATQLTPIEGFVAMPIDVTVLGDVPSVLDFVGKLQKGSPRPYLVIQMSGAGQAEEEASEGRPATKKGDLELSLSGYVYVLQETTTATDDGKDEGTDKPSLPRWSGGRDEFVGS